MDDVQRVVNAIHNALYEQIDKELENRGVDYGDRSDLHIGKFINAQIISLLSEVVTQEAAQGKFKRAIVKAAMAQQRETEARRNEQYKIGRQVWKLTQGKIPCLGGCGATWQRTENEVVYGGSYHTLCRDCYADGSNDAYFKRDIFDVIAGKYDLDAKKWIIVKDGKYLSTGVKGAQWTTDITEAYPLSKNTADHYAQELKAAAVPV